MHACTASHMPRWLLYSPCPSHALVDVRQVVTAMTAFHQKEAHRHEALSKPQTGRREAPPATRKVPPPPPGRRTTETGFPTLQHANAAASKPRHLISHHEAADHAAHALPPAPYPAAPPPAEAPFEMSARAQKKFDQLDLDSSGYVARAFVYVCWNGFRHACVRVCMRLRRPALYELPWVLGTK